MNALSRIATTVGQHPRTAWLLLALWCASLLAYGLYLQHVDGLEPCPMCVVQRYAMVLVGLVALVGAALTRQVGGGGQKVTAALVALLALFGAFVAARQSWLQWFPPEISTCGRDFFGMIEAFPLKRAIPMIFKGSGDCTHIDWTFLGLSIANWSFLNFLLMAALAAVLLAARRV
jgi:protein dithiol:quinone oxidoreductase